MIKSLSYAAVASVIRKVDHRSNSNQSESQTLTSAHGSFRNGRGRGGRGGGRGSGDGHRRRPRMSHDDIKAANLASKCALCSRRGHWAAEHMVDGTIKDNLSSLPARRKAHNQAGRQDGNVKADEKK